MTVKSLEKKIGKVVKVIFKEHDSRYPMIGKIVLCKDAVELEKKGMVRFVSQKYFEFWEDENPQIGMTRIYVTADFSQVNVMNG